MSVPRDLLFAARALRRTPSFTWTAVLTLALGIGATTAIFSVANRVLLEPLPYPEPDRLVQLMSESAVGSQPVVSIPKYIIWRSLTGVFQSIAAYDAGGPAVTLTAGVYGEALRASRVSADYFRLFGAHCETGRAFSAQEDRPGGAHVAVISHRLWRARFHGDPTLVGRTISLETEPYQVIGVLAPDFVTDPPADLWLPLQADPSSEDHVGRVRVAARLAPGMTLELAQKAMFMTIGRFSHNFPWYLLYKERFTAIPLRDAMVGDVRQALFLLAGAVGFVLLISCANVANLLLARATRRAREFAIRAALGAGRARIVRELLAESLILSLGGGLLGLVAGYLGVRGLLAFSPIDIPRIGANGSALSLDWRVFTFTLLVSLFTAILFGLFPALQASRTDVGTLMKDSASQSGMGFRRGRARSALVVTEMALALVLLAAAGLLIRTFIAMRTTDRGFDEKNVLTVRMSLANPHFETTAHVAELVRRTHQRLRTIPGVSATASTSALPLEASVMMPFTIHGHDQSMLGRYHGVSSWHSVSPDYFDVFRIRLLRGRLFTEADGELAAGVMLINRTMYKRYWPEVDANPIGDFVTIGRDMGPGLNELPRQVVGIVADVRDAGFNQVPMMYIPEAQVSDAMNARNNRLLPITWVVRTVGTIPPTAAIQRELREASGGRPTETVRTMHEVVAASSARTGFYIMLLIPFAGIALLLAAVGLYGLLAYSVQQRTQEIGVRMACGAGPEDLRFMVVMEGMRLALLGILIGIPVALALTRVMVSLIFGIPTWDPWVLAAVALLLGAVTLFATGVPAVRATRIDPMEALRV
jgi:putative ABC transport system permease protein